MAYGKFFFMIVWRIAFERKYVFIVKADHA